MYGESHAADTPSGDSLNALPAVLLVGGLGSRLRPVAGDVPKPMAPVAGRPFLEYVLLYLHRAGVPRAERGFVRGSGSAGHGGVSPGAAGPGHDGPGVGERRNPVRRGGAEGR